MKTFFQNQPQLKRLLFGSSVILVFLAISGLFSHLSSSNPRTSPEDLFSKRFKIYQAGSIAIKNVANVHSNLDKVTRWANAGFDRREIDLLGKKQLAALDGVNETIKKTLPAEWLTPEEKRLYEVILNNFRDYKQSCISTIALATSDLQMATLFLRDADDHFKELNRSLHDLLDLENRLSQETSTHPRRSFSVILGNLYYHAESSHRPISTDERMSRLAYEQSLR